MGLYDSVKDILGQEFSFRKYCTLCHYSDDQFREARNQLKAMAKRGYIKRIARNVYVKLKA
nr:hypothetical protein [Candidatus Sigynarchaeota archaeon]